MENLGKQAGTTDASPTEYNKTKGDSQKLET